jgi:hypothetical protein
MAEASCISAAVDPGCGDLAWTGGVCVKGMRNPEPITFLAQLSLESFSHARRNTCRRPPTWMKSGDHGPSDSGLLENPYGKDCWTCWTRSQRSESVHFLGQRWDHVRDLPSLYVDWHLFDPVVWSMLAG